MKIGVSVFHKRVSPRLDRCREVRVYELGNSKAAPLRFRRSILWQDESIPERAQALMEEGVEGLVCGAAEPWMEEQFRNRGIRIFSWVSGSLEEVLSTLAESGPDSFPSNPDLNRSTA